MKKAFSPILAPIMALLLLLLVGMPVLASNPGAIWTTDGSGNPVDQNIYEMRTDVYLNGGPKNINNPSLPDGPYYVKVTAPNGEVLGTSVVVGPTVTVSGGIFGPDRLWDLVWKASNGSQGYDLTPNNGGEYKVWISQNPLFPNNESKTDNFKVRTPDLPPCHPGP